MVNNNAAAVLLALESLARGREVVVSRGELIEIGGAFRIPDIMARSGARLVEVGTTNRTRLADYASAITPETALLLKVHPSNYRVVGFTESVLTAELAELGRARGIPVLEDLGSGLLPRPPRRGASRASRRCRRRSPPARTWSPSRATSSSAGRRRGSSWAARPLVERLRQNPLNRALRIDKLTLAALEATLRAYEDPATAHARDPDPPHAERVGGRRPSPRAPRAPPGAGGRPRGARPRGRGRPLRGRRRRAPAGRAPDRRARARDAPATRPTALDARLRAGRPPVIGRIAADRLLLDCRTVMDDEVPLLAAALTALV